MNEEKGMSPIIDEVRRSEWSSGLPGTNRIAPPRGGIIGLIAFSHSTESRLSWSDLVEVTRKRMERGTETP